MIPSEFNYARNLTSVLVCIAHFQVISYVFHRRAFYPRLTRTYRRVMRCVHPAYLGRGLVPSTLPDPQSRRHAATAMAVSPRHLIQPTRTRSKKRPLASCGCGSTPKISGISHGFSSVMPSSLLRGASFQDTNARPLIYRDVKDHPALQLGVSA